jgi:hypothetical protein
MGKATRKRRKQRQKPDGGIGKFLSPTPERMGHNDFGTRSGAAYQAVAPIRTLFNRDKLTPSQYDALAHYRQQAQQAEDDMREQGPLDPEKIMGGGCGGSGGQRLPIGVLKETPAIHETARIERDLGPLWEIARFVAVEDKTLSEWCIRQHGGRERYDGKGQFIAIVPVAEKRVMAEALLELKFAAGRIVKGLDFRR